MKTEIKVTELTACEACADIVCQGYTNLIDDAVEERRRCYAIDLACPDGHYWLGAREPIDTDTLHVCELCGKYPATRFVAMAAEHSAA